MLLVIHPFPAYPCLYLDTKNAHESLMPKSSAPKKKYRPKYVMRDPVTFVIAGSKPADQDAQMKLKIGMHMAMDNLTKGRGTRNDWQEVSNGLNVGLALCGMGYGKEFVPDLRAAQFSMDRLKKRYKQIGRFVFRAEEMQSVNVALDIHEQHIEMAPLWDFERALMIVARALAKGNFVSAPEPCEQQQPSLQQTPAA